MGKLCYWQGLKTQQIICSVIGLLTAITLNNLVLFSLKATGDNSPTGAMKVLLPLRLPPN
jgi:hypothetical protein